MSGGSRWAGRQPAAAPESLSRIEKEGFCALLFGMPRPNYRWRRRNPRANVSSIESNESEGHMMRKRHYNNGNGEFILEPLTDSVVRVTHRDQTGYFGISKNWDVAEPYTYTTGERWADDGGVESIIGYSSPKGALDALCYSMLTYQRREDSRRINPEGRRDAARQVLREFLEELPD